MIAKAGARQREAQYLTDTTLFVPAMIDEVSLLFTTEADLIDFTKWCIVNGIDNFNTTGDEMVRMDTDHGLDESFHVRFEFLRVPGAPWRIEAMCVLDGAAPLHFAHLAEHGDGCVVHASWKEANLTTYNRVKEGLRAEGGGLVHAVPFHAEYRNSYGQFSYWGTGPFYFKPRVNLRDIR